MEKIPCLFERVFDGPRNATLLETVTPGCEWVIGGEGVASLKWDGTACMVRDGRLYKRYDAKRGKAPPMNAIPCQEPDPVTGHWPHWVPVNDGAPEDKHHAKTWAMTGDHVEDGTYELVGPPINGNPEGLTDCALRRHGDTVFQVERTFAGLREFLAANRIEGIVFHHPDGRMCKIRRNDFGIEWGKK